MIVQLICTLALLSQGLGDIKIELFEEWSRNESIPMVSFGLPSEHEQELVHQYLIDLTRLLNRASGQSLTEEERSIELKFLQGMIAGLQHNDERNAASCVEYLKDLDDAVFGFSASKLWRMRLQAFSTLGDQRAALHAAQELRSLRHVSVEDQTVLVLFEIETMLNEKEPNINEVVTRFVEHDESLVKQKKFKLRDAFASGVLSLMQAVDAKKQLLARRLDVDGSLVQHQRTARATMRRLNARLETPVKFTHEDEQSTFKTIALWDEIDAIQEGDTKRVAPLLKLAMDGNHEASVALLSTFSSHQDVAEHLDTLFQHSAITNNTAVQEFWTLQRAIHCINNDRREEGLTHLYLIPESSIYADDATRILKQIHEMTVDVLLQSLKDKSRDAQALAALTQEWNEQTRTKVAYALVSTAHAKQADWHVPSIETMIQVPQNFPPSLLGELHRLAGQHELAASTYKLAIETDGETIETLTGLADVTRDAALMKRVLRSTSCDDDHPYWFWLANLRLLEWHLEEGGSKVDAIAKVNRLRKMDASLGGTHFQQSFNTLCE